MANKFEGSKYLATKGLDATAIAKLIRADIKAACASGPLPSALKVSVRTSYASMMQAIDVKVVGGLPEGFQIYNRDRLRYDETNGQDGEWGSWMAYDALELVKTLEAICNAYNFDNSDSQTDYFHVRFYGDVTIDTRLQQADRERALAELAAPAVSSQEDFLQWVGA